MRAISVPSVVALPLRNDVDTWLQDFTPNPTSDESDPSDIDEDPFIDGNIPQSIPLRLTDPSTPYNEDAENPKNHIPDDQFESEIYSLKFNSGRAGKPILVEGNRRKTCGDAYEHWEKEWKLKEGDCPFRPFQNLMEWEICQWALLSGPSKFCSDWLLNIPTVSCSNHSTILFILMIQFQLAEKLDPRSFSNMNGLDKIVDGLPARAQWKCDALSLNGFEKVPPSILWHRSIKECVQALMGAPHLAHHLQYVPERLYGEDDLNEESRIFTEMWTGDWWWNHQQRLHALGKNGLTILPLIFSSDKTQLSAFSGDKTAYPIYLTLGNIPNHIRRKPSMHAQILVGYLPTSKAVEVENKNTRSRFHMAIFHAAVSVLMKEVESAINDGGWEISCGDGFARQCMPLLACYIGDYPEQCLVACANNCPKCKVKSGHLGDNSQEDPRAQSVTLQLIAEGLSQPSIKSTLAFLRSHQLKPILLPFWASISNDDMDIHEALTSDTLHQIWQGVIKYLTEWVTDILGAREFNARVKTLPKNHHARHFKDGVTLLTQVSGREHKEICTFLVGCIQGAEKLNAQDQKDASFATRGLCDFAYIAEYKQHNSSTLQYLQDALDMFHEHKDVFIRQGCRTDFDLPKLHSLQHYIDSIRLFGTVNNYSTETTERLHIVYAKNPYRKTNHNEPLPQMTGNMERIEKVQTHQTYRIHKAWQDECAILRKDKKLAPNGVHYIDNNGVITVLPPNPFINQEKPLRKKSASRIQLAKVPPHRGVSLATVASSGTYQAKDIVAEIQNFAHREQSPSSNRHKNADRSIGQSIRLPFNKVDIWDRVAFHNDSQSTASSDRIPGEAYDIIHCQPWGQKPDVPGRQDTCLIEDGDPDVNPGISGEILLDILIYIY